MRLLAVSLRSRLVGMACLIRILSVEQDDIDGLIVTFSDGTMGAYVAEELLELRPYRELAHKPGGQNSVARSIAE